MGLWKKIKDWLKGDSDDDYKKKVKEANRINSGGGVTTKPTKKVVKQSVKKAKESKSTQTQTQTQTSKAFSNQSIQKAEPRDKQTSKTVEKAKSKPKKKDTGGTSDPFNTKNAFKAKKAKPPEIKHHSTALGTLSKDEIADRKVSRMDAAQRNYLAKNKYEPIVKEKYGGATQASKIARKQGEYQYDPDVAKYETLKHPVVNSAARGATAGATFGLSELAARKAKRNNGMDSAEKFYQQYKDPTAERLGEIGGSFASFGLTAGATEKVGAKLASKVAPKAAEKLAEKGIVKGLAEHSAKKLTGQAGTELAKQIGKDRATKIVNALGGEVVQNLTTGAIYDVANASKEYEPLSKEWWKELGKSAAFNAGMTTLIAGGSVIGGNKQLVSDALDTVNKKQALRNKLDDIAHTSKAGDVIPSKTTLPKIGESIDDRIARMDAERLGRPDGKTVEFPAKNESSIDVINPDLERPRTVEFGKPDEGIEAINPNRKKTVKDFVEEKTGKTLDELETAANKEQAVYNSKMSRAEDSEYARMMRSADEKTEAIRKELADAEAEKARKRSARGAKTATDTSSAEKMAYETYEDIQRAADEKAENIRAELSGEKPKPQPKPKQKQTVNNLGDVVNKQREAKTFRDSFKELKDSVRTKLFDSLTPFDDAARKKAKTDFNGMLDDLAASDKVRRHHNIASKSIENGQLKWSDGKPYSGTHIVVIDGNEVAIENGKSLNAIFDGMDEATENEFNQYLLLKHAPERIAADKPIFDAMELKGGLDLNDPEVCLAEAEKLAEKHPEFKVKAEELYQYNRNELQNRVDAGLLKQEVADEWNAKYPHYVPTGREVGFDGEYDIWDIAGQLRNEGNTVGAGKIKAATGGSSPIRSIKEQISEATTRNWRDMSMNNLFRRQFGDKIGKELAVFADGGVEKVLDNTLNLSKTKGGKYFAEVFENGDMHRVEIDKRFYDAIEDLYKNGKFGNALDIANDAFSKPSHLFKQLVTSWNPIFMVKNGLRDMSEAIINTRQTKEFLAVLASGDALDDLARNGEFTQALKDTGVLQSNLVNAQEALLKEEGNAVGKFIKKRINNFAAMQEMVETYPRLVEFMATIRKEGYYSLSDAAKALAKKPEAYRELIDRAALNAADVTVNFGRSGSVSKALNRGVVPFFNPSVQGFSKFVRNFSEQKSVASTLGMILKAAALGASATAINNYLLQDNPNYQQISARDKANNYIIPFAKANWERFDGNNQIPILPLSENSTYEQADTFIKIPKSRFASVYSLPTVNRHNENDMPWAEMIKVVKDQVGVVDPVESNIFSPFLQAQRNETWYGTPIVPKAVENENYPSQEYDENTSPFGVALGKATSILPKEFQISPKKADYVIDAETGVVGDFLLPASTALRNGNNPLDAVAKVAKKAFTIDSVTQNDLSSRFYDKLKLAEDDKKLDGSGEAEKAEYDRMNAYSTQISGINKAIKELQNGNLKMNQEDIRELQKVRNELYNDALKGKEVPSETKVMNAVQEHVGTTFAVDNFGTAADKDAMKIYGKSKYGDLSDEKMKQKIDADKDFYKGVKAIHDVDDKMTKAEIESNTTLTKAIALASASADDDLFGAYGCSNKGRNESASKMERARTYFKDGGSVDEYVKLEKTRKTVGRKTGGKKDAELEELENQLENGQITEDEYYSMAGELDYNPNTSYLGKAISFAQANSPERGYRLYDIKDANIQKGINLAAMGYSSGDVRDMKRAIDSDGNGYLKKQEIIDYINNSDVKDKATLFDALYSYKGGNPYGTPTKYTRAQAAEEGKKQGVEWITDETDDIEVQEEESGGGGGYYRRGRWHRWGRRGRKKKAKAPSTKIDSAFTSDDDGRLSGRVSTSATKRRVKIKSASGGYNGSVVKNVSTYSGSTPKPKSSSGSSSGVVRKVSTSNPRVSSSRTTSNPRINRSSVKAPTVKTASAESFYRGTSAKSSVSTKTANVRTANNIARTEARVGANPTMKKTALKVKNVKAPSKKKSNLSAALEDIKKTQKKVAPPKRRK